MSNGMEKRFREFIDILDEGCNDEPPKQTGLMGQHNELIADHLNYSRGLLISAGVDEQMIALHDYVYRQVWRHAVKHERELQEQG